MGALLVAGAAEAATTGAVHGRADLVSEPLSGDLEVVGARLEPILMPGRSSDVVLRVRNRGAYPVVADRVTLLSPLREARPAGCAAKVSGPLLAASGVTLTGSRRVMLAAGASGQIVVPSALSLAPGATSGCGFRVTVDVQALLVPPPGTPTVNPPTPSMSPIDCDPVDPTCTPGPTTTPKPPSSVPPTFDCDPFDPSCAPGPTTTPKPPSSVPPTLDCDPVDPACTTE